MSEDIGARAEPVGVPTVQAGDEPTEAMYAAAESLFDDPHLTKLLCNSRGAIKKFYCAMRSAAPSQPVAGKTYNDGIREAIDAIEEIDDGNAPEFRACQEAISALFRSVATANAGKENE